MNTQIRFCPKCKTNRISAESYCENIVNNYVCNWDLTNEPLQLSGQLNQNPKTATNENTPTQTLQCINGHPVDADDEMCLICGAIRNDERCIPTEDTIATETVIDSWTVIDRVTGNNEPYEQFIVEKHGLRGLLTLYPHEAHPHSSIYEIFNRLPREYVPEVHAKGIWQEQHYEVTELFPHGNVSEVLKGTSIDLTTIRQIVKGLGRILHSFAEPGLRHCNIRPEHILARRRDPLELVLTGFHYAQLSTFDLDVASQQISAHYMAPEVIASGISVTSDWWSLGMVLLELITCGNCFTGINEQAFKIHVVTRGISIPKGLDPSITLLLRGLLTRDPDTRWQWPQIQRWLNGESIDSPVEHTEEEITNIGPSIEFNNRSYVCPKSYALVAAESQNWEAAKDLFVRGVITTWLEKRQVDPKMLAAVRRIAAFESISDDFRHALALMWMNPNLPLTIQGEIVNQAWLLKNAPQGYEIITGPIALQLRQMDREPQICELHERANKARDRAKILKIELDEERFTSFALIASRPKLERQWACNRLLYPASDHSGLNSLMERQKIADEELVIILSASIAQFEPAEQILNNAATIALQENISSFDRATAQKWLAISRRELFREIEERITNYARCNIERIDTWADDFRIEGRISLPRALVLLSVPKENWKEPPRQQYVSTILELFEKRAASMAQRGPLVRMTIGKTTSRIDISKIGSSKVNATFIVEHLLNRQEIPLGIDPAVFEKEVTLERCLRHLISHAKTYRKDTGIDSLYLGFPFLVMRDSQVDTTEKKCRIAPVLLWPIRIDLENRDHASIMFDKDREEVRLNPALASLLGNEELKKWNESLSELCARSTLRIGDVIDAFGSLAKPRERILCQLPDTDYTIKPGIRQLVCSAVLFHAEFVGQAIGEDLRQMRRKDPKGTGLETVLRLNKETKLSQTLPLVSEKDRYFTVDSDPSQESAVFQARQAPGLLIEGPPGTGKSQTIVNIIADCIGHRQTVLVVCQKQAALQVLAKRLEAEGLRERFFYVISINKDRRPILQAIRTQLDNRPSIARLKINHLERQRAVAATKIDDFKRKINDHHHATHVKDDATGLSYRAVLSELIQIEEGGMKPLNAPALRRLLGPYDPIQLTKIIETCSPVSALWLESRFEDSPLKSLKRFSSDAALVDEFTRNLHAFIRTEKKRDEASSANSAFDIDNPSPHREWQTKYTKFFCGLSDSTWKNLAAWLDFFHPDILNRTLGTDAITALDEMNGNLSEFVHNCVVFIKAEEQRDKCTSTFPHSFEIKHPAPHRTWIENHDKLLRNMGDSGWTNLAAWFDFFTIDNQGTCKGPELIRRFEEMKQVLSNLNPQNQDIHFSSKLVELPISTVEKWHSLSLGAIDPNSFFGKIGLIRSINRYRVTKILIKYDNTSSDDRMNALRHASALELQLRPIRQETLELLSMLYPESTKSDLSFLPDLQRVITQVLCELQLIESAVKAILCCPRQEDAKAIAHSGNFNAYLELLAHYEEAFTRHAARSESIEALEKLTSSFTQSWITHCRSNIERNATNTSTIKPIIAHLNHLKGEQKFSNQLCTPDVIKGLFVADSTDTNTSENMLQTLRITLFDIITRFYPCTRQLTSLPPLENLQRILGTLLGELRLVEFAVQAIDACPRKEDAEMMAKKGSLDAFQELITNYEQAYVRHQARTHSLEKLDELSSFLDDEFLANCRSNIQQNSTNLSVLTPIIPFLPFVSAYQEFRLHVPSLSPEALQLFAVLRMWDEDLRKQPKEQLENTIRSLITREAHLAWKERLEQQFPILRTGQYELSRNVHDLAESIKEIRKLNCELLAINMNLEKIRPPEEWEDITRLHGPRSLRLRQVIERGSSMGLMQLRPVWLMNPETASQLFPLEAGFFDVVIFDEASQIPVENALPALFRAKRAIISGDEKQMPPSNLYVKRLVNDNDDMPDVDDLDDAVGEDELADFEDAWNRREIQDSPDLLSCGKAVLPKTMLEIHYRSKYRELIAFSNAAFYDGRLSIPVCHPDSVIRKALPIELIPVDGIYEKRTNKAEAEKVVSLLAKIWTSDPKTRPSIGVVTFNAPQAELIEDLLEERATSNASFRQALAIERDRMQEDEDMSFFVKNVENVQGDERDVIIFSSTFGPDQKGNFKRQFGLLSQKGGERRLNVAITRAREKILLVTSLPINEISDALSKGQSPRIARDYLQAYFDYASKLSQGLLEPAQNALSNMTSCSCANNAAPAVYKDGFVRSVGDFISSLGLNPSSRTQSDAFGLDFVLEDPRHKRFGIGIECDAYNHPILDSAHAREIWRPKLLSLGIPQIYRVTSYGWYHQRNEEMERLKKALEQALGIRLKIQPQKPSNHQRILGDNS